MKSKVINKKVKALSLVLSLVTLTCLPAFSETITPEMQEKIDFVSKYEVNLNDETDKQYLFDITSASVAFTFDTGKNIKVLVNDIEIKESLIGKTQKNSQTNKTTLTYYGTPLTHGKNIITAHIFDESGKIEQSFTKTVYVKGVPDTITINSVKTPADGQTSVDVTIEVKDKWNNPIVDGTFINVKVDKGEIKTTDEDPNTQGFQIRTKDGKAIVSILPPNEVDSGKIEAMVNLVRGSGNIEYSTPLREPIFVALAKGRSNYSFLQGKTFEGDPNSTPGINYNLGASLFSQGTIFDDYLLTFALNTEKKLNALEDDQNILLRDMADERRYPIYGDSSQVNRIAVSNSNVFFKLEKGKSSLQWGDFITGARNFDITTPRMSNYNRVLTGAKLDLNLPEITNVELFGAMTSQAYNRDEIRGAGVSGPYYTSSYPMVNGSERIMIETRDRTFKDKILKTQTLSRLIDYNIDYANGSLIFNQPVPTFDENLNPNFIVVTYEFYPNSINNSIVGARVKQPLPFGAFLGGSYIREISDTPYQLIGANIGQKLNDYVDFIAEYANSFAENKYGSSYRAALQSKPLENLTLQGEYQFVDPNFINRTGSSFVPGSERYLLNGAYKPFETTDLTLQYDRDRNFASGQILQSLNGNVKQNIFSHLVNLGLEGRNFPDPLNPTKNLLAGLVNIGYQSPSIFKFSFNANRSQNILGDVDQVKPTVTTLGIDYSLTDNVKLYAKQNFFEKEQLVTATAVGVDTGFSNDSQFFNSLNVGAKYQIDGALDGKSSQSRIGLNNKLNVLPGLALGASFERVSGNSPVLNLTDDHNAWSFSADYTPSYIGLRASAKYDFRDGTRSSNLFNFNIAGAIGDDFGLFGRFAQSHSADLVRRGSTDAMFGLAYRPLDNDFFNALLKYQLKKNNSGIGQVSDVTNNVGSFEGFFQPSYAWEIYTKIALKNSWDQTGNFNPVASNISLGLARITYKFFYNFDVVGEYRNLTQFETATSFNDFTAEIGYYPIKDLRIGAGYNLFGYNDKDLITSNYTAQGPYVNLTMKFDSIGNLWGNQGIVTKKYLDETKK